jgi:NAD(P)-dependent dehydrogenase (short-subunit alcohol dehydrogenase family)
MANQNADVTYDFTGQVALITGGARGIGKAHALGFARAGANVVIADLGEQRPETPYELSTGADVEGTAAEIRALGVECLTVACDVTDEAQVANLGDVAMREFGRIDVLVNNAGTESVHRVVDMPSAAWDLMIGTHLRGTFLCSQRVAREMIAAGRGRIICTGSSLSAVGSPRQAHYAAAKHGVVGFARSLAIELGPSGITVNVVCPGNIDTPMSRGARVGQDDWASEVGSIGGRWDLLSAGDDLPLQPEEVTKAILWLASEGAAKVTGAQLFVDTGFTIK